jgi:dihydropteroate synthase
MFTLNCKGRLVVIDKPLVMGIVNLTPDSFYAASRSQDEHHVLAQVRTHLAGGATFIDLGAQSTRPGSDRISASEEWGRLKPALEMVCTKFPDTIVSVDTFYAEVAEKAINAGAAMINDISGGMMDADMLNVVAARSVPYCCMHMRGTPQTMTNHLDYDDLALEVLDFFIAQVERCRVAGIHDVIIDPGFGFSKAGLQNFSLLKQLQIFSVLERPILVGLSRKSTVYKTLGVTADEALNGTTAIHMLALMQGTSILRVHDTKEASEAISIFTAYQQA